MLKVENQKIVSKCKRTGPGGVGGAKPTDFEGAEGPRHGPKLTFKDPDPLPETGVISSHLGLITGRDGIKKLLNRNSSP